LREEIVPMSVGWVLEAGPEKRIAEEETSSVRRERVVQVERYTFFADTAVVVWGFGVGAASAPAARERRGMVMCIVTVTCRD
jgi:hypothetical protein